MKILELLEKRSKAWDFTKAFLDDHSKDGHLSAEDAAVYDRMTADIDGLTATIDRLEKQERYDAQLSAPTAPPIVNAPFREEPSKAGRASDEYKRAFWNILRRNGDIAIAENALRIGADADGGFLVPDEYEKTLVAALEEENIFRKFANVIQTSNGEKKIPVASSHGTAAWLEEGAEIPESDDHFGQITLSAYKLGTTIKVSNELINDSVFNIEQYIAREFARRIGEKEEESFFIGDGTGKPTGILASTGGGQVGVTTAGAATITLDEIIDLYHSLKAPYRAKAVFVVNDQTVKAIRKLKDGNGQYLWTPSVTAGTPDTLLNRPVYTSPFVPAIAAGAKTIVFGDLKYYWVADRQGRIFQRLNELYARTGQVGFLATERLDGRLILPEAVKILQQKA